MTDVVVIGAGPYGLSIAAFLRDRGIDFRIFGDAMQTWLHAMPRGMKLKSEGFASSLYDPHGEFTLAEYCRQQNLPYADAGLPVPIDTFSAYGLAFQKRFVPQLENRSVIALRRVENHFEVELDTGERVSARRVVLAVGLSYFPYVPPVLSQLVTDKITHSSKHEKVEGFRGAEVAVIGAGASAVDLAALLHQAGAKTHIVARSNAIRFHDPPGKQPRPLMARIKNPGTGLGPGWKLLFYTKAPLVFHRLSPEFRVRAVRRTLGPAPGWFVKQDVVGKVPMHLGVNIQDAAIEGNRVVLRLADASGKTETLSADYVIAATGYRVDVDRVGFLSKDVREKIETLEGSPVLSTNFESSVPGLYFVGTAAANSFGPLMRFAYGAGFTSRQISRHLAKGATRRAAGERAVTPIDSQPSKSLSQRAGGER